MFIYVSQWGFGAFWVCFIIRTRRAFGSVFGAIVAVAV